MMGLFGVDASPAQLQYCLDAEWNSGQWGLPGPLHDIIVLTHCDSHAYNYFPPADATQWSLNTQGIHYTAYSVWAD